jgi:hypothetical protein
VTHDRPVSRQPAGESGGRGLGGGPYSYFRYETHLAARNGLQVYDEAGAQWGERIRSDIRWRWRQYRSADAEICFVMIGSFATKAKAAVDALRAAGLGSGWSGRVCCGRSPARPCVQHCAGKRLSP